MDLLSSDQSVYPHDPNLNESKNKTFENLIVKLNVRIALLVWRHDSTFWKVVGVVKRKRVHVEGEGDVT